jgi:peptidase C39-like protein
MRRGLAAVLLALLLPAAAPAAKAPATYSIDFQTFALASGERAGTGLSASGELTLSTAGLTTVSYTDPHGYGTRTYDAGTWTGGWRETPFGHTQAVASWIASTPAGTWIQVELRARAQDGHLTKWYVLGRWAYDDDRFHRTSLSGQGDRDGFVAIDTWVPSESMLAYQLRLTLYRESGTTATPAVTRLSAVASNPSKRSYVPSTTTMTQTTILDVPQYSQEIHAGHYPEFDNGGEAWCSPTSTSMILGFWGRLPSAADYAYITAADPAHPDPWVDHAARYTYDYNYQGAGNWPFNVAYAGRFGLTGAVTQLHSLAEAEQFIKAGIPLVASLAFGSGKLDGFFFKSTNGHLLTIIGFTAEGNVVSNDPASPTDADVRHVYDRAQFEKAWLDSTGGIVYLMYPPGTALPPSPGNW